MCVIEKELMLFLAEKSMVVEKKFFLNVFQDQCASTVSGNLDFSNLLIFKPLEHSWAWKKTNLFYFLLEKICLWEKKSLCFPRPVCLDCFEELGFFKFINIHASWAFLSVKEKLAYSIFYWKKHGCRDKKISKFFPRQVCLDRLRKLGIFQIYKYLSLLNVLERVLVYPF